MEAQALKVGLFDDPDDVIGDWIIEHLPDQGSAKFDAKCRSLLVRAVQQTKKLHKTDARSSSFSIDCQVGPDKSKVRLFAYQQVAKWLIRQCPKTKRIPIKRAVFSWRTGSGKTLAMINALASLQKQHRMCIVLFTRANERSNFIKACIELPTFLSRYVTRRFDSDKSVMRKITHNMQWTCSCTHRNSSTDFRCQKCKTLHADAEKQVIAWMEMRGELSKAGQQGFLQSPIRMMSYAKAGGRDMTTLNTITNFQSQAYQNQKSKKQSKKQSKQSKQIRYNGCAFVCDEVHNFFEACSPDAKIVNPKLNEMYIKKQRVLMDRIQKSVNCLFYGFSATPISLAGDAEQRAEMVFDFLKGGLWSKFDPSVQEWSVPKTRADAGFDTKGRLNFQFKAQTRSMPRRRGRNAASKAKTSSRLRKSGFVFLYHPDVMSKSSRTTFPEVLPSDIDRSLGTLHYTELQGVLRAKHDEAGRPIKQAWPVLTRYMQKAHDKKAEALLALKPGPKLLEQFDKLSQQDKKALLNLNKYTCSSVGSFHREEMKQLMDAGSKTWHLLVSQKLRDIAQRVKQRALKGQKTLVVCPGTPSSTFLHAQTAICASLSIEKVKWLAFRSNRLALSSNSAWKKIEEPGFLSRMLIQNRDQLLRKTQAVIREGLDASLRTEPRLVQVAMEESRLTEEQQLQDDGQIEELTDIDLSSEDLFGDVAEADQQNMQHTERRDDDRNFEENDQEEEEANNKNRTLRSLRKRRSKPNYATMASSEDDDTKDEDYQQTTEDEAEEEEEDQAIEGGQQPSLHRSASPTNVVDLTLNENSNTSASSKPRPGLVLTLHTSTKKPKSPRPAVQAASARSKKKKKQNPQQQKARQINSFGRAVKTKIRNVYKALAQSVRQVLQFIYEDSRATVETAHAMLAVLAEKHRTRPATKLCSKSVMGVEVPQRVCKLINQQVQALVQLLVDKYLNLFVQRMEATGRSSNAQKKFVKMKLKQFNDHNNATLQPKHPCVLVICDNHMESTSIMGVRHVEFVCLPASFSNYMQFRGRVLRSCASHITRMPESKRSVEFHLNIARLPQSLKTRRQALQAALPKLHPQQQQSEPVQFSVDEILYAKNLLEKQRQTDKLEAIFNRFALDRQLYSDHATGKVVEYKQKVQEPSRLSFTMAPIPQGQVPVPKQSKQSKQGRPSKQSVVFARRYLKTQAEKKARHEDLLEYTRKTSIDRITAIAVQLLGIMKVRVSIAGRQQIKKFFANLVRRKMDADDTGPEPVFSFGHCKQSLSKVFRSVQDDTALRAELKLPHRPAIKDFWNVVVVIAFQHHFKIDLADIDSLKLLVVRTDKEFRQLVRQFDFARIEELYSTLLQGAPVFDVAMHALKKYLAAIVA
jgi:hypothetical protein